jgi:hypothetical protein
MASDAWKTGVTGDWGVPGNWTAGLPNAPDEDVTIVTAGTYTVTVGTAESFAASNVTLDNDTATLDLAGDLGLAGPFTLAAGLFDLTGTLATAGSLELDGGTLAMNGALDAATISLAGADMVLNTDFDYAGSFLEPAGTLDLNGLNATLAGTAQLGTGSYSSTGDTSSGAFALTFAMLSGPGTLDITGIADINSFSLSNGAVLLDNGTITDDGYLYFGGYTNGGFFGNATDSASMTVSAGAVFDFTGSSMPLFYEQFPISYFTGAASSIVNAGLFEMTAQGRNAILPFFTNMSAGTIDAAVGGILRFTGGGLLAGKVTGAGEIDFTGGTYTLAPGLAFNVASFAIAGEGFASPLMLLNGSTTLTGNGQLGEGLAFSGLDSGADGTVAGPGVLDLTGTVDINSFNLTGGATLEDSGTIILNGSLDLGDDSAEANDAGTDAAFLSIAAGGVFDIAAGGTIYNYDVFYGDLSAASFVNAGLFELTGGTNQSQVDGPFTNTGTVFVNTGTLLLSSVSGDASGTLGGGTWEVDSSTTAGASLALETPAAITTDDAKIILSGSGSDLLSGPSAGTAVEQSLTSITSGGLLALLEDRGFTAGGNFADAGTIELQGGVFAVPTLNISVGGVFAGYGTLTGAVDNNGLIEVTDPTLTMTGDVSGAGSLRIDPNSELILEEGVSSGTEITFGNSLAILGLAAPSAFSATLVSFAPSDTIELIGISSITSEHFSDGVFTLIDNAGSIALTFANPAAFSAGVAVTSADGNTDITEVTCYAAGTRIATPGGYRFVEDLKIGDLVRTLHAGDQRIKWIGWRCYDGRFIAGNRLALPVCIKKNAIDLNIPARDLWVSPGHAICIDNVLVHASKLVNDVSIVQEKIVESITYFHIELENHEILFAENCPAESFMGEHFRSQFHNAPEFQARYPGETAPEIICLPRLESGFHLHAIQTRLRAKAGISVASTAIGPLRGYIDQAGPLICSGWAQDGAAPEEPVCLDILADGRRLGRVLANLYRDDVRAAGFGSGAHGFEFCLPPDVTGHIDVQRASDGAGLRRSEAAMAWVDQIRA